LYAYSSFSVYKSVEFYINGKTISEHWNIRHLYEIYAVNHVKPVLVENSGIHFKDIAKGQNHIMALTNEELIRVQKTNCVDSVSLFKDNWASINCFPFEEKHRDCF